MSNLALVQLHHNEPMTTSENIAEGVGIQHKNVLELIRKYVNDLQKLGGVAFETRPFETDGGTQWREIAFLNEQQATFLLTLMRNTEIVIAFKLALVQAFFELRDRPQIPERDEPLNLNHRADIAVAADRTFRAMLRSARSTGMRFPQALRRANHLTLVKTGVDMLAELEVIPQDEAPEAPPQSETIADMYGVHAFIRQWMGGELPIPVMVCKSADLYAAYVHWVNIGNAPHLASQSVFPRMMQQLNREFARVFMEIYVDGAGRTARLVVPPGCGTFEHGSITMLRTQQVEKFAADLKAWMSAD